MNNKESGKRTKRNGKGKKRKDRKVGKGTDNKTLLTVCSGLRVIGSRTKPC